MPRSMTLARVASMLALFAGAVAPGLSGAQEAGRGDTGLTGILSEEEFKALHELRAEKAPPARGEMIEIAGSRAYLSLPENAKPPLPGLVVIQEWWGLNDNIKHWTDRLAADGYAALAVDLYEGKVATTRDAAMKSMQSVDEERALEILLAAHRFLAEDERIRAEHRGCIGWCFGGGWSLRLALNAPDLDAAVVYYGRLVTDQRELDAIQAAILGVFGNQDRSIPSHVVDEFGAALDEAGIEHEILRYDAAHAFANPSSARYDQESASAAWTEVRAFLAEKLERAP